MKTLTTSEANRLEQLTKTVRDNLEGAFAVGLALAEIKGAKLYRAEFDSFEDFCRERFSLARAHAYRLIESAEIKMSPVGDKIQNERQARAISAVPESEREAVMQRVVESGPVTAKAIAAAAKETPPAVELDKEGRGIPPSILPLWQRADAAGKEAADMVSKIRGALKAGQAADDLVFGELAISSLLASLDNLYADLKRIRPHAVCHVCHGVRAAKCRACKGRGFVSKFFWDTCVPEEFKK